MISLSVFLLDDSIKNRKWRVSIQPESVAKASRYTLESLTECVQNLYAAFIRAPSSPQTAVREKFKHNK